MKDAQKDSHLIPNKGQMGVFALLEMQYFGMKFSNCLGSLGKNVLKMLNSVTGRPIAVLLCYLSFSSRYRKLLIPLYLTTRQPAIFFAMGESFMASGKVISSPT